MTPMRQNPWFTIWTRPRATMREILDTDPEQMVVLLAMRGGFGQSLDRASLKEVGNVFPVPIIILFAAVGGAVGGLIWLYLVGFLVRWTGRWIGGKAPAAHVRAAIAWPIVPLVLGLLLWIPALALFGEEIFKSGRPNLNTDLTLFLSLAGFVLIKLALGLWAFVLFVMCLAEAQGFSAWRAMTNAVLSGTLLGLSLQVIGRIARAAISGFS